MLEDKQGYDFSHRAKVIEHEGERYYHSEWVSTRDKVIERLQTEKSDLLSLIDHHNEAWEVMANIPMGIHPSEIRDFAKKMLKGEKPYTLKEE